MKTWIIPLIIAGMFFHSAHAQPSPAARDSVARATISMIWNAAREFNWDKGKWPSTVEELVQNRYLEIDSSVLGLWRFVLVGCHPQELRAISTEPANEERDEFPPEVRYDVLRAQWRRYPPMPRREQGITEQERVELAENARETIEDIWQGAKAHFRDAGTWPETVAELERHHFIELDIGVDSTWQFAIIGSPPQAIVAVSKKDMPDGAGRAIEFDIVNGAWRGYGQP